jgi:hypothetical protein
MVLLPSLTGPELAHEKVGATMHHTVPLRGQAKAAKGGGPAGVGGAGGAAPGAGGGGGGVGAGGGGGGSGGAGGGGVGGGAAGSAAGGGLAPQLAAPVPERGPVGPGGRSIGDDDPTTIMNRLAPEEVGGNYHPTVEERHPFGAGQGLAPERPNHPPSNTEERIMATAKATTARTSNAVAGIRRAARDTGRRGPDGRPTPLPPVAGPSAGARVGVWILVVMLAIAAGAAGAYYLLTKL